MKNKRYTLVLLLSFLLITVKGLAYDFYYDGIYYNIIDDNSVEVTKGRVEYIGDITIPQQAIHYGKTYSVISIGEYAFDDSYDLTSIIIPNSVTSIGLAAFADCRSLTSITIPNSVTSIGDDAFFGCHGFTSITIPNSVTTIGKRAFFYCTRLTSITLSNSVTSISYGTFCDCYRLTSIIIPNSVSMIGDNAFDGCCGITSITIPNSVKSIGGYAFYNCSNLTSISIPSSVTNIGNAAFQGCSSLMSVSIPESVTSLGAYAFVDTGFFESAPEGVFYIDNWACDYKGTILPNTTIALQEGTTRIAAGAFLGFPNLVSITIPNTVIYIGYAAFAYCSGLISITIPNSVTSIDYDAFYGCTNLSSVTIPNSVTSIGNRAFAECTNLTSVISEIKNPYEIDESVFYINSKATLTVPAGTKEKYKNTKGWNKFMNILETSSTDIYYSLPKTDDKMGSMKVYSLNGQLVLDSKNCDLKERLKYLSSGIYIVNGKKTIK